MTSTALASGLAGPARAATTSFDRTRTILFDGRPTFPLVLSPGPPPGRNTPWGTGGLTETATAGANVYRTGPGSIWTGADVNSALAWDRAAAALHVYTWPNLSGYSQALPGSPQDAELANVVSTLIDDPSGGAIAFWKGRDEPWYSDIAPSALQFALLPRHLARRPVLVRRREPARPEPALGDDRSPARHPSRPRAVLERHRRSWRGHLPRDAGHPSPDLSRVGKWTASLVSISALAPVWTTIQICASGSLDKTTGDYVLPTFQQERYMAYDAILNGAKVAHLLRRRQRRLLQRQRRDVRLELVVLARRPRTARAASSRPRAPSRPRSSTARATPHVTTGPGTETLLRQGTSVDDLWLIAARSGPGTRKVTFKGLPRWAHRGGVYTENRTVTASHGRFATASASGTSTSTTSSSRSSCGR